MSQPGMHTYQEITSQPGAWAQALCVGQSAASQIADLWRSSRAAELLFTGCGSTYYLSLAAAALARSCGIPARAAPASEIWLMPEVVTPDLRRVLLVAVSRSGETTETVKAVEGYRRAGGPATVLLTCYPESILAGQVDLSLAVPAAQEQSVAQTRSFASMLVLAKMLAGAVAGDAALAGRLQVLPSLGEKLLARCGGLAEAVGSDLSLDRFFFLGSGPLYGLAEEVMLKMKEMTLSYSEGYHPLEFRHGPKSMVQRGTMVVCLMGDRARAQEAAVLAEMKDLGAETLALSDDGDLQDRGNPTHLIHLGSGLPERERLVLYLPVLQLLAYHRAVAKGLDPDRPRNLTAAILL
jgi:glucosamine--fructose-6-phosphate aminotransferase (isomerizing)